MRHYHKLDQVTHNKQDDSLIIGCQQETEGHPSLWFAREGMYVSISASYGPLEIALRPRLQDLTTSLAQLKPTDQLSVTRLVGTGQAHLELGLSLEGELLARATIVADATGYIAMNALLAAPVTQELFKWLDVQVPVRA
jgi:hypothetical protein